MDQIYEVFQTEPLENLDLLGSKDFVSQLTLCIVTYFSYNIKSIVQILHVVSPAVFLNH